MHKEQIKGVASMKKHNNKPKSNSYGEIKKPKMVLRKKKKVKPEGGSGNY